MRKAQISENYQGNRGPIKPGQPRKPKAVREGRHRQPNANSADDEARQYQKRAGAAFDKRNFAGAYDMNDKRLRQDGFYEPAGLKKRRVLDCIGPEPKIQKSVGHIVKNRAGRSKYHHEFSDVAYVPFPRAGEIVIIDMVGWDGSLRKIVKQIVG